MSLQYLSPLPLFLLFLPLLLKDNIILPHKDRLYRVVENLHVTCYSIMDLYKRMNSSPKSEHPKFTPEDGTEPKNMRRRFFLLKEPAAIYRLSKWQSCHILLTLI
ncbi:MAG: hypothetical protein ACJ71K_21965 [Nitrososphaeraceae archaeon]